MTPESRLLELVADARRAGDFTPAEWLDVIRTAKNSKLLPRVALLANSQTWLAALPVRMREQLRGALPVASHHQRTLRWEVNRILAALRDVETTVVLLKGAAYEMAGLPAARGRIASDVDILVSREDLRAVEAALVRAGWAPLALHPYDQRYYREWSHELPPLQHRQRRTVVDVHHNILPLTGRLRPDPAKLLAAARPIEDAAVLTLSPADMVLHTSAHLFQDGELAGAVRDLVDADALMRDFGAREPGFWEALVPRATDLGLTRPLFYAVRYASRLLDTPVPAHVVAALDAAAPPRPVLVLMDALVHRSLLPVTGRNATVGEDTARLLLYARSHWLRMPPGRLTSHLWHKAMRRWTKDDKSEV
jgi:hypothetical protein